VSAVTHELRTPLTTLRLYLDMLVGGLVREEGQRDEYLRTLHGVEQPELRFDHAGMRLGSAELGRDGAMQIDEVLNREVTNAAVSR